MAALNGGLGRLVVVVAAAGGDDDGDLFPLVGSELTSLEGVPFLLVGLDEADGFLMRPWNWLGLLGV